jgi:hypothetical protein
MAAPPARGRVAYRTLATVVVVAAAAAAMVWALAGRGPSDVETPAGPRIEVAIGEPVAPALPAGDPPNGQIELRAVTPNGATLEGLYFTDGMRRASRSVRARRSASTRSTKEGAVSNGSSLTCRFR